MYKIISLQARSLFGSPDRRSLSCTLAMEIEDCIIYKCCCSILKWLKECVTCASRRSANYYFLLKHNFRVLHLHGLQVSALPSKDIKYSIIKLRELSTSSCTSLLRLTDFFNGTSVNVCPNNISQSFNAVNVGSNAINLAQNILPCLLFCFFCESSRKGCQNHCFVFPHELR